MTFDNLPCQGNDQGYGPWDYTHADERKKIPVVEQHHFTTPVENHIKGQEGRLEEDLDYTLRAVPNHHRALLSIIRYQIKFNRNLLLKKAPLISPVECYLQRAIHFSPRDAGTVSLYAYYLKETGQKNKADDYYQKALTIAPDNAKIAYSYSLLLVELQQYEKAMEYAKKAYANKKAPPALKNKLIKLGYWKEPVDK
ncbi:tetratricopeptide repeat protein [Methylomonas methanica]|uniref:TPR repeat-containing protein n=1 Tax=Methylomonas methanica (strain DSM 25384 / MC09) TaxID=857087 RepID=F9ZWH0_METMM|nr:tetratricopeptide repeat protein [Methylomonas methanica]AEF99639.1 TPR repeat-containing protein [Methylomonas methanica MC09]